MKPVVPVARLACLATAILVLFQAAVVRAEDYPDRQVTMVVPVAAGGAVDVLGTRSLRNSWPGAWESPSWWRTAPAPA